MKLGIHRLMVVTCYNPVNGDNGIVVGGGNLQYSE